MKGHFLIVGVNKTNRIHYGNENEFEAAKFNVNHLKEIFYKVNGKRNHRKFLGYGDRHILTDQKASWECTKDKLNEIINNCKQEDKKNYLFLYLSGHSFKISKGKKDILFFKFYDYMVSELQIRNELKKLKANTKVFWVIDSCFSSLYSPSIRKESDSIDWQISQNQFESALNQSYNNFYREALKMELEGRERYESSILLLSSNGRNSYSVGDGKFGMTTFTDEFLNLFFHFPNQYNNYFEFANALKKKANSHHFEPNILFLDKEDKYFEYRNPFNF